MSNQEAKKQAAIKQTLDHIVLLFPSSIKDFRSANLSVIKVLTEAIFMESTKKPVEGHLPDFN